MDEMMNMNETTMENETSVEVVPEENVQMIDNEETSSNGSGIGLAVGAVGLVAAVGYGLYRKHKAKKQNKDEEKPKAKKKIVWQSPGRSRMSILHRWTFLTRTLRKLLKRSNVR